MWMLNYKTKTHNVKVVLLKKKKIMTIIQPFAHGYWVIKHVLSASCYLKYINVFAFDTTLTSVHQMLSCYLSWIVLALINTIWLEKKSVFISISWPRIAIEFWADYFLVAPSNPRIRIMCIVCAQYLCGLNRKIAIQIKTSAGRYFKVFQQLLWPIAGMKYRDQYEWNGPNKRLMENSKHIVWRFHTTIKQ